jgi:hypothetical protein
MALVASSKMLQHQFLEMRRGGPMWRTFAINNINHLAFIPKVYLEGSGIRATPRATFSVANLHVNRLRRSNGGNARGEGGWSGHRAEP